jgi:hypothetical protein
VLELGGNQGITGKLDNGNGWGNGQWHLGESKYSKSLIT